MNYSMKNTLNLILAASVTTLLSACGAADPGLYDTQSYGTNTYNYNQNAATSDGAYLCPASPNVLPARDVNFDGTQRYTVCANPADKTKALVKGTSSSSAMVCAYPVQYVDTNRFVYKLSPSGLPMFQCANVASSGRFEISFPSTNYNALVVVDYADQLSMSRCLVNGQTCPNYSMGRFQ